MLHLKDIAEWIRKHDPYICCLQETDLRTKDLHRLKVKGWKKIFQANGQERNRGINIYIRQNRLQNKSHRKRGRQTSVCGCLSRALTGDLAHKPGMCPDWESKRRPFGLQAGTQPLSHTSQSPNFTT